MNLCGFWAVLWQDCGKRAAAGRAAKSSGGGARGDEVRRAAAGGRSPLWSLAPWEGVGGETKIQGGGVAEKRPALRTTAYSSLPTSSKRFVRLARQNDAASQGKEYHDPGSGKTGGCMRRLSGLRFFMLRESVYLVFPGVYLASRLAFSLHSPREWKWDSRSFAFVGSIPFGG